MKNLIALLIFVVLFSSFNRQKIKPYSGFDLKEFEKSLILIPEGQFTLGQGVPELSTFPFKDGNFDGFGVHYQLNNERVQQTIELFYISETEVSNGQYLEFIKEMREKKPDTYHLFLPDTSVWRQQGRTSFEALTELYFRHPAFTHHPVVGVSHDQAIVFFVIG